KQRKKIEPIPCKCPVGTCRSAVGCRTLLTICLQGKSAIDLRTLLQNKAAPYGVLFWLISLSGKMGGFVL
ncbi:MAG: hypothetical protein PUG34_03815, partial [Eubacteriales bacterium]|nr:hypothetical protein [Eubacteriales bacterium]